MAVSWQDWLVLVCFNTIPWSHLRNQISLKCNLVLVVKLEHLRKLEKVRPVRDEGISMMNGVWVMTSSGRERWVWYADMSLLKNFALLSLQWNGMPKCLRSREAFDGSWFGGPCWSVVTLWLTVCCEAGVVGPMTGGRSYPLRRWSLRTAAAAMDWSWIASSSLFWWGRWCESRGGLIGRIIVLYFEERWIGWDMDQERDCVETCGRLLDDRKQSLGHDGGKVFRLLILGLLAWAYGNFGRRPPNFIQTDHRLMGIVRQNKCLRLNG